MSDFTSGEWVIVDDLRICAEENGRLKGQVCSLLPSWISLQPEEEIEANARLIAYAPRMYQLLKYIQDWSVSRYVPMYVFDQIGDVLRNIETRRQGDEPKRVSDCLPSIVSKLESRRQGDE